MNPQFTKPPKGVTVALIHLSSKVVPLLTRVAGEVIADLNLVHMVDEGMLRLVARAGRITEPVIRRLCNYAVNAQEAGAQAVMLTSPIVGEALDAVRAAVRIPAFRIDAAMAETAVQHGSSVGVLATADIILQPTLSLLREMAHTAGKDVLLEGRVCEEAEAALMDGELDAFDRIVTDAADLLSGNDVVVLADVMMHRVAGRVNERLPVPVLTCPRQGFEDLARKINYFRR